MLEIMLNKSRAKANTPLVGYNYSQGKSTSVQAATTVSGGAIETLGSGMALAGYTKSLRMVNTSPTFNNSLVGTIGLQDYTMEGWFYFSVLPTNYQTVFLIRWGNADIGVQFGDSGFGYRLQAEMNGRGAVALNYACSLTTSGAKGRWIHIALVRKDKRCKLFINGVLQALASGTSTSYSVTDFDGNFSLTGTPSLMQLGGTYATPSDIYSPEFALWLEARYTANFTPASPLVQT